MIAIALQQGNKLLESKLIDLALSKIKFSVVSALLLASLIVAALWPIVVHERLLAWLAAIALIMALHIVYLRRYKRLEHDANFEPGKCEAVFVAGAAASGLGWGGAIFCFPSSPFDPLSIFGVFVFPSTPFDPVTVLVIFVLAGVAAYASMALASVPSAAMVFLACALLPLAIWLFSFGERMYSIMGLITLSYLGVMAMLSRQMYATICSLILASEENKGLASSLCENELRMVRYFESAPGFFYTAVMSPQGESSMPFTSGGVDDLFGIPGEKLVGSLNPLLGLMPRDDVKRLTELREQSRKDLSPLHVEFRIAHQKKGERWIELNSRPQRKQDGSTIWHGFMYDITEREKMKNALAENEHRYRMLVENSPFCIHEIDLQGRLQSMNRAGLDMLGLDDAKKIYGIPYLSAVSEQDSGRIKALLQDACNGAASHFEFAASGDALLYFKSCFIPIKDADGKVVKLMGLTEDITERRAMEMARESALAEAQRLAQLRSAFMAQMSHELRTPLNGILGYTQNLLLDLELSDKQFTGLSIIQHSGDHLLGLLNDVLDHAKIEADKLELNIGSVHLEVLLRAVIELIQVRAAQKKLEFVCHLEADLPAAIRGDEQRLRQVLLNLLSNAVKFTDRGQVVLRVSRPAPARIRFEVRDSGIGIAANKLEAIFQPFEQIGEDSRRAGGTGLGLAISRKLVRLMGGEIAVESRPGEGSVFCFELDAEIMRPEALDASIGQQSAVPPASDEAPLFVPPQRELESLYELARWGNMRNIAQRAASLAEMDERYAPFAGQLEALANGYQSKAIVQFVEQFLAEDTSSTK